MDIHYKGFKTRVLYDSHAEVFYGTMTLNQDIVAFQTKTLTEAEIAMQEAINHYLEVVLRISTTEKNIFVPLSMV